MQPSLPREAPILPAMRWSMRRRPPTRLLLTGCAIGLALGSFSAWLVPRLMLEPAPGLGIAVGVFLALLAPATLLRGALVEIDDDGELRYGFGREASLSVPLAAIAGWKLIDQGLLVGIGAQVEPQAVRFLSRRGPSYATLRRHEAALGSALVLEWLYPEDLEQLRHWQEHYCGQAAPLQD